MFGIIGAMKEEIQVILSNMKDIEEVHFGIRTFYCGTFQEQNIVIVQAGIGKVNAGITTSLLIENFDIDYIVNIGVAGGQKGVKHGDVVISSEVLYHDVDVTKFDKYVVGQIPGQEPLFYADELLIKATKEALKECNMEFKLGKIASGDQFVTSVDSIQGVNQLYSDIYAVEMEAAAIAHTATMYKIPFIIYRSISDVLGDTSQNEDFNHFLEMASQNASKVLSELLLKF